MTESSFEPDTEMDLQKTIDFLRGEIFRLERVVASLEEIRDGVAYGVQKKRGGRKSMSAEQRQKAAERMRRYWAGRRKKPGLAL